jgi:hypothetical protein
MYLSSASRGGEERRVAHSLVLVVHFVAATLVLCDRAAAGGARRATLGVLAAGEAGLELAPEARGAPGRGGRGGRGCEGPRGAPGGGRGGRGCGSPRGAPGGGRGGRGGGRRALAQLAKHVVHGHAGGGCNIASSCARAVQGEDFCVCVLKTSGGMSGCNRYLVRFEWSPSSIIRTSPLRPCSGCSKCADCEKEKLAVVPYHEETEPNTFHVDSKEPVTVNREETRTTDTNEKEFKKGETCFYKSENGPFEEGIIESVDNSLYPPSYTVKLIPRVKVTTAKNLYRELPRYYSQHEMSHDPVHEIQSDHIVAGNNGPWSQSNEQLKNQLSKSNNFSGMMTNRVHKHTPHEPQRPVYFPSMTTHVVHKYKPSEPQRREYFPSMMTHRVHNYKPSGQQPNIATESTTVRGKLPSESAVRSRRAGPDTSTAEPRWLDDEWNPVMYPEAEFGCMSLKSLYQ